MDCESARDEILESFDEARSASTERELAAHLAGCPACAAFAAQQRAVDARLSAVLVPPELSPTFRPALRRKIRRATIRTSFDALPDIVHFASFGGATLLCAVLLPFDVPVVFGAGTVGALLTYVLLATVRSSLDAVDHPDR